MGNRPTDGGSILTSGYTITIIMVTMIIIPIAAYVMQAKQNRQLIGMMERMAIQADHDDLTNLPNRRHFDRLLEAVVGRPDRKAAVMCIDMDRFKTINQSFGHATGDRMIAEAADRLKEAVGNYGTVSRYRGDAFAVLIDSCAGREEPLVLSNMIMQAFRRPFLGALHLQSTTSIGIAVFPEDGSSASELMRHANAAMYRAKELGGNGYRFFNEEIRSKIVNRAALENDLWRALEDEQFVLHFQPQVDAATGAIAGAEALVRWRKPSGATVSPGHFIPLSEETGFIIHLGEWVLRQSCKQAVKRELTGHPPIKIAVNVSPKQLQQHDFVSGVERILAETGFDPSRLVLEITESLAIEDLESTITKLEELKRLGIHISMDDFGTGYASLGYLQTFRVNSLKIAQTFTKDIVNKPEHAQVVKAILAVADILELEITVEGVETKEQLAFFEHCDNCLIQGYYYYKPMPMNEMMTIERTLGAS